MNSLVKNVFLVIMGVVVAFILYVLFFGFTNWNGGTIGVGDNNNATRTLQSSTPNWMGLMFYMTAAVELNMSKYYEQYCYIPATMKYIDTDAALFYANQSSYSTTDDKLYEDVLKNDIYQSNTLQSNLEGRYMSISKLDTIKNEKPVQIDVNSTKTNVKTGNLYYTTDWY